MKEEMNDIQFDILDAVYFVESFEHIREEVEVSVPVLVDELRNLIARGWIQVMQFEEDKGDYMRTAIFDTDHLEAYSFLATREGLMKHNGR